MPLEQQIWLNPYGVWFRVPGGYFNPWPSREVWRLLRQRTPESPEIEGLKQATGISFAFWMPNLRWPERDRFNVTGFRPCEDGRRIPKVGEYIVEAHLEWPWLPGPEKARYVTAGEQYANALKYLAIQPVSYKYGLTRLENPDDKSLVYFALLTADLQILLRCSVGGEVPNPSCDGDVWWPQEMLGIYIRFSLDDLPKWRANVEETYSLIHRWRNEALNDREGSQNGKPD